MTESLNRTMYIRLTNGEIFNISIPNTAKITYGNLHPGSKSISYGQGISEDRYVLRIYEGVGANQRQTAVFRGVDEFRDTAYTITKISEATLAEAALANAVFTNTSPIVISPPPTTFNVGWTAQDIWVEEDHGVSEEEFLTTEVEF